MSPYRVGLLPLAVYAWVDPTDPDFIFRVDVFPTHQAKRRWPREVWDATFTHLGDWRWYNTGFLSGFSPQKPDGTYWPPTQVQEWRPNCYGRREDPLTFEDLKKMERAA